MLFVPRSTHSETGMTGRTTERWIEHSPLRVDHHARRSGGIAHIGTYTVTPMADGLALRGAGAAFTGGFVSGAFSSHAGAVAEPLESAGLKFLTQAVVGGGGSAAGGGVDRALAGQEQSWNEFVIDGVGGAGLSFFPGADGLAQVPTMGDHLFAATGGQHASWIVDSTEFVLKETGVIG